MRIWQKIKEAFTSKKETERFVLCIDGGGMRGIIPVVVLKNLEKLLRERGVEKEISQCFDLIAGTSTGGLITLSLTMPGSQDLDKLLDAYINMGKEIFPQAQMPGYGIVQNIMMLASAKYSPAGLERLLKAWFSDSLLSEAMTPAMIISYDLSQGRDFVMRSWEDSGIKAWEAGRATSAAPTYFPPLKLREHLLVDGGVIANNPAMFAYAEAKKMWPESKITVFSISTGSVYHSMDSTGSAGLISWAEHIFPMFNTAQKRSVDYLLNVLPDVKYIRLDQSLAEKVNMDETNPRVLRKLVAFGEKICNEKHEELSSLADALAQKATEENHAS